MKGTLGRIMKLVQHQLPQKNAAENGGIHPDMAPKDMWKSLTAAGADTVRDSGRRWLLLLRWSTLAAVIASIGIFYYIWQTEPGVIQMEAPGHYVVAGTALDGARLIVDSCGHAGPFELVLPDSTKVRLCFGSSLRYVAGFEGSTRDVYLEGQASFDIAEDIDHPFIVHTGMATVRVLGTYFNVMAYGGEPAEITVLSGAVAVQSAQGHTRRILKPSEQAMINENGLTVRRLESPVSVLGWANKEPVLDLDNVNVNTVIRQLARWYQVRVSNQGKIKGMGITGILKLHDPMEKNLAMIGFVLGRYMQLEEKTDTIILTKPVR